MFQIKRGRSGVALTQFSGRSFATGLTPSELRGDFKDGFLLALGLEGAHGCGLASPWQG